MDHDNFNAEHSTKLHKLLKETDKVLGLWMNYVEACSEGLPQGNLDRRLNEVLEKTSEVRKEIWEVTR